MIDHIHFLSQEYVQKFVRENIDVDVNRLVLNPPSEFKDTIKLIADQITSLRKAKSKLPDWYRMPGLILPPPLSLEQASSQLLAEYKASLINGHTIADLTGGMGIDALAWTASYKEVHYVERDSQVYQSFYHNLSVLNHSPVLGSSNPERIRPSHMDAEGFLERWGGKMDVYVDPARRSAGRKVFRLDDCTPNVPELMGLLKKKANRVLLKAAPLIDLSDTIQRVPAAQQVHVVSLRGEVKEVLFLFEPSDLTGQEPVIHCVNVDSTHGTFSFKFSEERCTQAHLTPVQAYLYDPNASIMKAGAFKTVGSRYGVSKVGSNTHLYTSEQLVGNFPGRIFKLTQNNCSKSTLKQLLNGNQANVISKNHPNTAEELKRKFKVSDGGGLYVLAYRNHQNKPELSICERIS